MKRIVGATIGLVVVALVLVLPVVFYALGGSAEPEPEPTDITSYVADFTIADNGDLTAAETITVDFGNLGRHGIFRFFDKTDLSASHARRIPHDITVTMDGKDVPVDLMSEGRGRYVNAKIGDPATTLSGQHTYVISYRIDGVLEEGTDGVETQFYWNLIPSGWQQTIAKSKLTVHLPVAANGVQCTVGHDQDGCRLRGDGTETLVVRTGAIDDHTPVTVKVGLDMPTPPAGTTVPWTSRFDPVLGQSVVFLIVVLVLSALAGLVGWLLARRTREENPQFPLLYAPPDGLGPAQASYLVTERIGTEQYVATLMYAAEKQAIDLDRADDAWTITDKQGAAGWAGLDPVTSGIAHLLGGPGTSFTAAPKDVSAGLRLKEEIASFEGSTKTWASSSGLMVKSGLGRLGGFVIGGCFLLVILNAIINPFNMTFLALVPGAFAVLGAGLAAPGAGTRRTKAGRDLWSRAGGFRRILSTPSAQDRFDFSGRQELYTAYIPWAVAFGCADEWAEKYRVETASEPPAPSYFGYGYAGAYTGAAVSSMVGDFQSTVTSAISSYEATQQSSSSGGGGGFSGGGGGGGGGGGSW